MLLRKEEDEISIFKDCSKNFCKRNCRHFCNNANMCDQFKDDCRCQSFPPNMIALTGTTGARGATGPIGPTDPTGSTGPLNNIFNQCNYKYVTMPKK